VACCCDRQWDTSLWQGMGLAARLLPEMGATGFDLAAKAGVREQRPNDRFPMTIPWQLSGTRVRFSPPPLSSLMLQLSVW